MIMNMLHMKWIEARGNYQNRIRVNDRSSMEIIHGYRECKALRDSFNELAEKTFELNFENWYRNGFWKENYDPFSVVIDGKVVANVSVNQCNMMHDGKVLKLIQFGTVMTDPEHRGKGYARMLMEEVMKEYEGKVDGMYLYANDSVLDFYLKFGFTKRNEYQYSKKVYGSGANVTENIPMDTPEAWAAMVDVMKKMPQQGTMTMTGNEGLYMFYLSQFMTESVYYLPTQDTYAVAEIEDDTLVLHAVFGPASTEEVIAAFGNGISRVVLCFTPENTEGYDENVVEEEDTTFFVKGKAFDNLRDRKFMLQAITHA